MTWRRRVSGSSDQTRNVDRRASDLNVLGAKFCNFRRPANPPNLASAPARRKEGATTGRSSALLAHPPKNCMPVTEKHCNSSRVYGKIVCLLDYDQQNDAVLCRTNPLSLPASPWTRRRSSEQCSKVPQIGLFTKHLSPVSRWLGVQAHEKTMKFRLERWDAVGMTVSTERGQLGGLPQGGGFRTDIEQFRSLGKKFISSAA